MATNNRNEADFAESSEAAEYRRDAERYRHLRRPDVDIEGCAMIYCSEALDSIVDASIEGFESIAIAEAWSYSAEQVRAYAAEQVAAERERCAKIVEEHNPVGSYHIRTAMAAEIRRA